MCVIGHGGLSWIGMVVPKSGRVLFDCSAVGFRIQELLENTTASATTGAGLLPGYVMIFMCSLDLHQAGLAYLGIVPRMNMGEPLMN